MKIKFFCPRWGFEQLPWKSVLQAVKAAGYAGIEWFPYGEEGDHREVLVLLQELNLEFSIVMSVTGHHPLFEDYMTALEQQLQHLACLQTEAIEPLFISAQTGRDYYSTPQVERILNSCKKICQQTCVPVYQETHRTKWAFAAHVVAPMLDIRKDLFLTLDISHSFCVSESYLHDQQEAVANAIRQARHIHARVGHTQGPQVWDPAIPEFAGALREHLNNWDQYIEQRRMNGDAYCTITPEFGPPSYMVFGNR